MSGGQDYSVLGECLLLSFFQQMDERIRESPYPSLCSLGTAPSLMLSLGAQIFCPWCWYFWVYGVQCQYCILLWLSSVNGIFIYNWYIFLLPLTSVTLKVQAAHSSETLEQTHCITQCNSQKNFVWETFWS